MSIATDMLRDPATDTDMRNNLFSCSDTNALRDVTDEEVRIEEMELSNEIHDTQGPPGHKSRPRSSTKLNFKYTSNIQMT